MFTGYLAPFYLSIALHGLFTISTHPRPLHGLLAHFIFIPAVIAALSAEAVLLAPDTWKARIRSAFQRGTLTRAYAFGTGLVTGVAMLILFVAGYFLNDATHSGQFASLKEHEAALFWTSMIVLLLMFAFAPLVLGAWLSAKSEPKNTPN